MNLPDQNAHRQRTRRQGVWTGVIVSLLIMTFGFAVTADRHGQRPPEPDEPATNADRYLKARQLTQQHEAQLIWAKHTNLTQLERGFAHIISTQWAADCRRQYPYQAAAQANCYQEHLTEPHGSDAPVTEEALLAALSAGYDAHARTAERFPAPPWTTGAADAGTLSAARAWLAATSHCYDARPPWPPDYALRPWTTYRQELAAFEQCLTQIAPWLTPESAKEPATWPKPN